MSDKEKTVDAWLAVQAAVDTVRLIPTPGAVGPDVFVKRADYDAKCAEVERLHEAIRKADGELCGSGCDHCDDAAAVLEFAISGQRRPAATAFQRTAMEEASLHEAIERTWREVNSCPACGGKGSHPVYLHDATIQRACMDCWNLRRDLRDMLHEAPNFPVRMPGV